MPTGCVTIHRMNETEHSMSSDQSKRLRALPKVDSLLNHPQANALSKQYSQGLVVQGLRELLEEARQALLSGKDVEINQETLLHVCEKRLSCMFVSQKPAVINASGILLHTNLGRAPMAKAAAQAAYEAAINYTPLEYDLEAGQRGDRQAHVEGLLSKLLGAQAALVLNNNAAAVLLMLSAIATGHEVVVSRGELVEIGGSFRVPEVMEQSGCVLREVGATNKTKITDYKQAINDNTAALLKVHTSNYKVVGFTQSVEVEELSALARQTGLPLLADLGSGALLPLSGFGLMEEPGPREALQQGADVVCFSGDKLLGGPQAGILAGRKDLIASMKKHPLMRALRPGKMSLAALEATLQLYQDPNFALRELPLYQMLALELTELNRRALRLQNELQSLSGLTVRIADNEAQLGGGSAPGESIPSLALALQPKDITVDTLARNLRLGQPPVIGRIHQGSLLLDLRTVREDQLPALVEAIQRALRQEDDPLA